MRIVMDDAGDVPASLAQELNICIIPVNIMFGTEQFLSGVTMDHDAFYEKVRSVGADNFPKTSQPTPYQFEQLYRQLLDEGEDEILTITVSEKLSGTYAAASAAVQALDGRGRFHLFDSQAGSAAQGWMAIEAARMARDGAPVEEILARLNTIRREFSIYFLINSLEYAVKGGRVGVLRSTMASLLNVKPIMTLKDGVIVEAGRVRTYGKAVTHIVEAVKNEIGDRPVRLAVIHGNHPESAEALMQQASRCFDVIEQFIMEMAISVAINLGPGALALVAVPPAQARHEHGDASRTAAIRGRSPNAN